MYNKINSSENTSRMIPSNIITLVEEMQLCYGYDLSRQFIATGAILVEGVLIEINYENGVDIQEILKKQATLGRIISSGETRKFLTRELRSICLDVNSIRTKGTHFALRNIDIYDVNHFYDLIKKFALALVEAHAEMKRSNGEKDVIGEHWCDLIKIIQMKEHTKFRAETALSLLHPHSSEKGSWLGIYNSIVYFMPLEYRVVFCLVFKYQPRAVRELVPYTNTLPFDLQLVLKSLRILSTFGLLYLSQTRSKDALDIPIYYNDSVRFTARKYCSIFWTELMGQYLDKDPDLPRCDY